MSNNPLVTVQKRSSTSPIRKLELTRGKGSWESVSLIAILEFVEFDKTKIAFSCRGCGLSISLVTTRVAALQPRTYLSLIRGSAEHCNY